MTQPHPEHEDTPPAESPDQGHDADVISFPGTGEGMRVTEVDDSHTADEVVDVELVDAKTAEVEPYAEGPAPAEIMRAYWRRTRQQARPDRLAWAIVRHEFYFGTKGLAHAVPPLWRWMTAAELAPQLATNPRLVLDTRKKRRTLVLVGTGATVGGALALWLLLTPIAVIAALAAVLTVSGAVERTRSSSALEGGDTNRAGIGTDPSARDLKEALSHVKGLGQAEDMRVLGPIVRDEADTAWTAIVQMPVTYRKVKAKAEEIAAELDVTLSQLRLSPVKTSEARVKFWCADEDPLTGPPIMSPLIGRTQPVDIWREQVFLGSSTYGTQVDFTPINKAGMLTGGESGSGKSVADDQLLCAVALDPYAQMWLVDAKMVELEAYRPIAHEYLGEPDREEFKALVQTLSDEKDRRLREMAKAGVVRITADNWRKFDAPFILFHVDEVQMFTVGEKKGEVSDPLGKLASQCRAVGIFVSIATQYPTAEVVPTFVRGNLTLRLGMRCESVTASNVILGEGMAGRGYNASAFTDEQKGAAWLKGEKGDPVQLRTGYLEKPDEGEPGDHHVRDIIKVATELRAKAGTLPTGDDRPQVRVLDAMIALIQASGQRNLHTTEHLLPGLAARLPEAAEWTFEDLAAALPEGVRTGGANVRAYSEAEGREMSRAGYRLADLQAARKRL